MKKKIKINEKQTGYYTAEEIFEIYKPFIEKVSFNYLSFLRKFNGHAIFVDIEDLRQVCIIGIFKAYNQYDYNYKSNKPDIEVNDEDKMGFFPFMEKTVLGAIQRYCRDILHLRRKDINLTEIKIDSYNAPVREDDENKEVQLIEVLDLEEEDCYEDLINKMEVDRLLSTIPEKHKSIIIDSYFNNMTQIDIGKKYGISQVQVSRIIKKSINSMRRLSNKEENNSMKKIGLKMFEYSELVTFLTQGVNTYATLDEAIKDFCKQYVGVKEDEVYLSLNKRKASYDNIKSLYERKALDLKEEPVVQEEKESKATVSISSLSGIEVVDLTANINGIAVKFSKEGISLNNLNSENLSIIELKNIQKTIEKVIEINNTIYK